MVDVAHYRQLFETQVFGCTSCKHIMDCCLLLCLGGLYHGTSVGSPPSWGQSLRATLSVFLFSVPIMMVIMGTMTAITGGVTTPMLLLCVILMLVTFLIFSLRYSNNKEESGNTTGTLGTTKNLEWIYTCVILHYAYFMFTIYYYDPKIQISTGVHQTFGPCGVEGTDMSGLKRSIYMWR